MKILRALVGIIVGYLLYALGSMLAVGMVMAREGPASVALGLLALLLIGGVSGYLASAIAGDMRRLAAVVLAGLVAVAAIVNLAMQLGAEPAWYKVAALLLTAPIIVIMSYRSPQ